MRHLSSLLVVATSVCVLACDQVETPPVIQPLPGTIRLAYPDPTFRLSADERARVAPAFDADALERLLANMQPQYRPEILKNFLVRRHEPGEPILTLTVKMGDPVLNQMLGEVWQPYWVLDPDAIDHEDADYPGRELARARRDARRQHGRG
jgi:hypothetical protein